MRGWKSLAQQQRGWLIALVTGLLLPLVTNLLSAWFEATVGRTPNRLLQLLAILAAAVVVILAVAMLLRERTRPLVLVPRDARPEQHPGLIALVGRGRPGEKPDPECEPAALAIDYHLGSEGTLKACWLIASAGVNGSVPMAEAIKDRYDKRCIVKVCPIGDAWSLQDTYDAVQWVYNEGLHEPKVAGLGLAPEQVICDFTGGTAPMTAGMVLACGQDRPMQYTTGRRGGAEPAIASVPMLVRFRPSPRRRGSR